MTTSSTQKSCPLYFKYTEIMPSLLEFIMKSSVDFLVNPHVDWLMAMVLSL